MSRRKVDYIEEFIGGEKILKKRCGRCEDMKHVDEYHKGNGLFDKVSMCKACCKADYQAKKLEAEKLRKIEEQKKQQQEITSGQKGAIYNIERTFPFVKFMGSTKKEARLFIGAFIDKSRQAALGRTV
jgi:hypothetical protein